ncbi:MAG: hypothetical protein V1911_00270, partial [Candidatus Micrarchaeota archaeon]
KSKDIDIVVDHETLSQLKSKYSLNKNTNLKKYELKSDRFDIDIYVPFFSELAVPAQDILKNYIKVNGIKTVSPELLLILKQSAEIERRGTPKGMKDAIDLLTLLLYSGVDLQKYVAELGKYKLNNYIDALIRVIKEFDPKDADYVGLDFVGFRKEQKRLITLVKQIKSRKL